MYTRAAKVIVIVLTLLIGAALVSELFFFFKPSKKPGVFLLNPSGVSISINTNNSVTPVAVVTTPTSQATRPQMESRYLWVARNFSRLRRLNVGYGNGSTAQ